MSKKNIKDMTLKERFDSRGFSPMAYAKAYSKSKNKNDVNTTRITLNRVLSGAIAGVKQSESGVTRKLIAQLKKDGVWIGPLPWEK